MNAPRIIALVGFMGSGKTLIGRRLAERRALDFIDLDEWIETRSGRKIRDWFRESGEPAFRAAELEALRAACDQLECGGGVLALGGGTFASAAAREDLRARTLTIWLDAPWTTIAARITDDGTRPLFREGAPPANLFSERTESYALADLRIDASGDPESVLARIDTALPPGWPHSGPEAPR